jgi:hypothetical protein
MWFPCLSLVMEIQDVTRWFIGELPIEFYVDVAATQKDCCAHLTHTFLSRVYEEMDVCSHVSCKGHFTLRQSVDWWRAKDCSFRSTFTLEANGQQTTTSKMPTWQYFFGVLGPSLLGGGKFVHNNIYGNPNSPQADKFFFPNLYKLHYLYILMDFYLVLLRRVCTNFSQPNGRSVKWP